MFTGEYYSSRHLNLLNISIKNKEITIDLLQYKCSYRVNKYDPTSKKCCITVFTMSRD